MSEIGDRLTRIAVALVAVAAVFLCCPPVFGEGAAEKMAMPEKVEINPQLGASVPLDLTFRDETGKQVLLRDVVTKPTVVAPVYFSCRHVCPRLLSGLAEVLGKTTLEPGRDFSVLAISFDDSDTPEIAARKKRDYLKAIGKPFPETEWRFLTADREAIGAFTRAVGFSFKKEKQGFTHPVTLIFLSASGKVVRYLSGTSFLPFDLELAVTEAEEERIGSVLRRTALICFSYDPAGKKYVFNLLRVVGLVTIVVALSLVAFLVFGGKQRRAGDRSGGLSGKLP